ncbi:MAG: GNAT family N-acetyltransferase [Oscillospiraceae bacterium]|nr:GNAT family N-acetyltransferase [Oscillospiraceae bacterium]
MTIETPRPGDETALRRLWKEAFGDDDLFLDGFFETAFSPHRCRCVYMDNYLAAALYWFDCSWNGKKIAYIYAVATDKAYRGRNLCRSLMENTHAHLLTHGYTGAALVPGSRELFTLYGKLGYRPFCPMEKQEICAGKTAAVLKTLTAAEFGEMRRALLPQGGILQEGVTLSYLARFTDLYEAEGCVMSLYCEEDTACFQEFLGDPEKLPGILAALGVKKGAVRLPGGKDSAMYYSPEAETPSYLGLSLG